MERNIGTTASDHMCDERTHTIHAFQFVCKASQRILCVLLHLIVELLIVDGLSK